jgi:hypothetical protein
MTLSYEQIHWGSRPDGTADLDVFLGPGSVIGRLEAISYAAEKDGIAEVYRHEFESAPDLICGRTPGTRKTSAPPGDTIMLGRAIDVELENGDRIVLAGTWIITDSAGRGIWLATEGKAPIQVGDGPIVTPHGIER